MVGVCLYCKKEYRKRENKRIFCSIICSNRSHRNGLKLIVLPEHSEQLAELIGICLGDGTAWGHQVSITLNSIADKKYIPHVKSLAEQLFPGVTVSLIKRKVNAVDVRITSKIVTEFLKENGIVSHAKSIPQWIIDNPRYVNACIRGLFDTEGSISFKIYESRKGLSLYKQLTFRNTNSTLIKFVRDNLLILGLRPTMTLNRSLHISNNKSIQAFCQTIGFSNPKLVGKSGIVDIESYNAFLTRPA